MIKFLTRHPEKIYIPLLEHIQLVFLTLVISVAIAAVLTLVCLVGSFCHSDPCDGTGQDDRRDCPDCL